MRKIWVKIYQTSQTWFGESIVIIPGLICFDSRLMDFGDQGSRRIENLTPNSGARAVSRFRRSEFLPRHFSWLKFWFNVYENFFFAVFGRLKDFETRRDIRSHFLGTLPLAQRVVNLFRKKVFIFPKVFRFPAATSPKLLHEMAKNSEFTIENKAHSFSLGEK